MNNKFNGGKVKIINIKKILKKLVKKNMETTNPQLLKNVFMKLVEDMWEL